VKPSKRNQDEALEWMLTQDDALNVALSGAVKQRHIMIALSHRTVHYRTSAHLRQIYSRRMIHSLITAELRAEAYRKKKDISEVFPDLPGVVAAIEDCFLSNLRSAGYDATRENWPD
jgi:hypothetical protein